MIFKINKKHVNNQNETIPALRSVQFGDRCAKSPDFAHIEIIRKGNIFLKSNSRNGYEVRRLRTAEATLFD